MTRPQRLPRPRQRPAPGQMSLDGLLRAYPDARRFGWTRTGWGFAVLDGHGVTPEPGAPVVAAELRRAA